MKIPAKRMPGIICTIFNDAFRFDVSIYTVHHKKIELRHEKTNAFFAYICEKNADQNFS